ncbi:hypothetical protein CC2G_002841 [Coprinopsis cinerea AmutBmut pab1-1]|nr:hypothetical protein CC2G_002841 [Coprinopsis cinerea AmutBmut pab1-1]
MLCVLITASPHRLALNLSLTDEILEGDEIPSRIPRPEWVSSVRQKPANSESGVSERDSTFSHKPTGCPQRKQLSAQRNPCFQQFALAVSPARYQPSRGPVYWQIARSTTGYPTGALTTYILRDFKLSPTASSHDSTSSVDAGLSVNQGDRWPRGWEWRDVSLRILISRLHDIGKINVETAPLAFTTISFDEVDIMSSSLIRGVCVSARLLPFALSSSDQNASLRCLRWIVADYRCNSFVGGGDNLIFSTWITNGWRKRGENMSLKSVFAIS